MVALGANVCNTRIGTTLDSTVGDVVDVVVVAGTAVVVVDVVVVVVAGATVVVVGIVVVVGATVVVVVLVGVTEADATDDAPVAALFTALRRNT